MSQLPQLFKSQPKGFEAESPTSSLLDFSTLAGKSQDQIDTLIQKNGTSSVCPICQKTYWSSRFKMFGSVNEVRTSCACPRNLRDELPVDTYSKIIEFSDLGRREVGEFRLDRFRVTPGNKAVHTFLEGLISQPREALGSLWLYGPPKCGKTHLVCAFLMEYAKTHQAFFQYVNMRTFSLYIPDLKDKESWAQTLTKMSQMPIMVLDHVGEGSFHSLMMDKLSEILQTRYDNSVITIYISREAPDVKLQERLSVGAASIISSDLKSSVLGNRSIQRIFTNQEMYDKNSTSGK